MSPKNPWNIYLVIGAVLTLVVACSPAEHKNEATPDATQFPRFATGSPTPAPLPRPTEQAFVTATATATSIPLTATPEPTPPSQPTTPPEVPSATPGRSTPTAIRGTPAPSRGTPTRTPTASAGRVDVTAPDSVARGSTLTVEATTPPYARCTLAFKGPSGTNSSIQGTGTRQSDGDGYSAWSLSIPEGMARGTGSATVTCGGISGSTTIRII